MSHPETVHQLAQLLKVIADETRLRILGTLAEQPMNGKDLAVRLDLTPPTISHHMRKLTDAGIVVATSESQSQVYRLNSDLLLASRRTPITPAEASNAAPADKEEAFRQRTIRSFMDGERLKSIPAQRRQRVIVLQLLMERFDPNRAYPEREVNAILSVAHDDVATLRRELVDYGFLNRDKGIYQVARRAPPRSKQVQQEITGDEDAWLSSLIARVIAVPAPE